MKIAIRYYSRSGNTKKLAEAIAQELGVEALDVTHPLDEDVDILFLGSAVYAAGVDNEIKQFIDNINVNVGAVANFSTAAIINSTYNQVEKLLEEKGIKMLKDEFYCRGKFMMMHKSRPNSDDIENAKKFARKIIEV